MRRRHEKGRVERLGHWKGQGRRKDERGFVLMIVLIIIVALALLGLAANRNILTDIGIAENNGGNTRVFYAAEAGVQYGYNQLYQTLQAAGAGPVGSTTYTQMPNITGCSVGQPQISDPPSSAYDKGIEREPVQLQRASLLGDHVHDQRNRHGYEH